MKTSTVPLICGVALTAMCTAGLSHWWSVRQFVAATGFTMPAPAPHAPAFLPSPKTPAGKPADSIAQNTALPDTRSTTAAAPHQKEFYEALISKMNSLQTQNRDLLDQLAETNRDLMKLEFRVDTHSESFRPLPVTEERIDTSFEDNFEESPGVLPPRAEPVFLPTQE
jgi:hypothetical protein